MLQNETEIIKEACCGNDDAFEKIYKEYEGLVYTTAFYMTKNSEDSNDISQDVFIKLYKALPTFRGECKFSSWIYKICVNTVNDYMRKNFRTKVSSLSVYDDDKNDEVQLDITDESPDSSPEMSYDKKNTQEVIRDAIEHLPDDMKQIINLRDIQGYSYEELCSILSLKSGTVKSRINRARTILREYILKKMPECKNYGNQSENEREGLGAK